MQTDKPPQILILKCTVCITFYVSTHCPHSIGVTRQLGHSHLRNLSVDEEGKDYRDVD